MLPWYTKSYADCRSLSDKLFLPIPIQYLLKNGIIEKMYSSPLISPIVMTARKGGKICLCVDLREPNNTKMLTVILCCTLEELLNDLRGASGFTTIDVVATYHQLTLHEECRDITCFIMHNGLFRYCRVPYGLASAPAAFQKIMETVPKGIHGVRNYHIWYYSG